MRADLSTCRLYGIVDLSYVPAARAVDVATQMLAGGVNILQLRAKQQTLEEIRALAVDLHSASFARGVPLIINDHPDIARDVGAEGVHVGQDDLSVAEARARAGNNCIVGKSTHSIEQALAAAEEGADYIGFGPLFATATKPDYQPIGLNETARVHELVSIPIFCIGGIKLNNLAQVIAAGAKRVVIVSGLLQAADIAKYAGDSRALLNAES